MGGEGVGREGLGEEGMGEELLADRSVGDGHVGVDQLVFLWATFPHGVVLAALGEGDILGEGGGVGQGGQEQQRELTQHPVFWWKLGKVLTLWETYERVVRGKE